MGLFYFLLKKILSTKKYIENVGLRKLRKGVKKTLKEHKGDPLVGYVVITYIREWGKAMENELINDSNVSDMTDEEITKTMRKMEKKVSSEFITE